MYLDSDGQPSVYEILVESKLGNLDNSELVVLMPGILGNIWPILFNTSCWPADYVV